MKCKINFTDENGKKTTTEVDLPEKDHLLAQQKYPARVYKNKKKERLPKTIKEVLDDEKE